MTYTHKDAWKGAVPAYQGSKLPKTMQFCTQKKPLSIVYNGDSITVGAESSKWNNIAPFAPIWTQMVTEELKAVYGGSIQETNTAVGGMDSKWGLDNVQENINKHNPNLVVLGFGMNDGTQGVKPEQFQSNIEKTIQAVRAKHPNCEFILVSTTLPNPDVSGPWTQYQPDYQDVLGGYRGSYVRCGSRQNDRYAHPSAAPQAVLGYDRQQYQPSERFPRARLCAGGFAGAGSGREIRRCVPLATLGHRREKL